MGILVSAHPQVQSHKYQHAQLPYKVGITDSHIDLAHNLFNNNISARQFTWHRVRRSWTMTHGLVWSPTPRIRPEKRRVPTIARFHYFKVTKGWRAPLQNDTVL